MRRFDFDAEMARMGKQGRWLPWAVWVIWTLTFIGIAAIVGLGIYAVITLEPADLGRFFGQIVSGYSEAAP